MKRDQRGEKNPRECVILETKGRQNFGENDELLQELLINQIRT